MIRNSATFLTVTWALTCAAGCRKADSSADEYRAALPTKEAVQVQIPGGTVSGQALTLASERPTGQSTQGSRSDYYAATVGIRDLVNGGTVLTLGLVKTVTAYPPTTLSGNVATWGPFSDALKSNAWRVTVTKIDATHYNYKFEGRDKHAPEAPFVTVLSGAHSPTVDVSGEPLEGFGSGNFTIDWDAAATLPDHDDNTGTAAITYSRPQPGQGVAVQAKFRQVTDRSDPAQVKRVDVDYSYLGAPDGGGALEFTFAVTQPEPGKATVKSRWLASGAGRADVKLVTATVNATTNECWDVLFQSVYQQTSWDATRNYGDVAACPFADAEYSTLQL